MKKIFNPLTPPFDTVPSSFADIDIRLAADVTLDDGSFSVLLTGIQDVQSAFDALDDHSHSFIQDIAGLTVIYTEQNPGDLTLRFVANNVEVVTITETLFTSNIAFLIDSDSAKLRLGADQDFDIFHDGTNGYLDNNTGDLIITATGSINFGTSANGEPVNFYTDASTGTLTWTPTASASSPFLLQNVESGRGIYWRITGTDSATVTSSLGYLTIDPTLSGSITGLQGANILLFTVSDGRNISGASGGTFSRIMSGKVTRTGTHSGSSSTEATQVGYLIMSDSMTYTGASTTKRDIYYALTEGAPSFNSSGTLNYDFSYFHAIGTNQYLNFGGTTNYDLAIFDAEFTYSQALIGGTINSTVYGFFYHPTISTAPTTEYAMRANRAGIYLASDGVIANQATGRLVMGATTDWERLYEAANHAVENIITGADYVFRVNNADEVTMAADAMTFNNGATDTGFGWATSGVLDFTVAAAIEMSLAANLLTFNAGSVDPVLDWSTDGALYLTTGRFGVQAGGSTSIAKAGGNLQDHSADSTVGGAEADIYSYTTPASVLGADGDKIIAMYGGNFVTVGTELTQLKVYFAGTAIWDSTGVAPTSGTTSWRVYVEIVRVSSTVVRYTVSLNTTGASGFVYAISGELTSLTLSNTNIIKITGTSSGVGSGSGDIVGKMGFVEWRAKA